MPRALGTMIAAEFEVDEVALVASRLHQDGARYETIETWALPSAAAP
jgi:2'-5' RNA ligase